VEVVEVFVNHFVVLVEFTDFAEDRLLEVIDCFFDSF